MEQKTYQNDLRKYTYGYVISALLTLAVYVSVMNQWWDATILAGVALIAAILQLIVQSRFFLHLKSGKNGGWKLYSYIFTWIMVIVVVFGSLWVMMNLNYNMHMTPEQMLEKIEKENKKGF